jgi:hypothetical protein
MIKKRVTRIVFASLKTSLKNETEVFEDRFLISEETSLKNETEV